MIIEHAIHKHCENVSVSAKTALEKITKNKLEILFLVNKDLKLEGVLSIGDFSRWLLKNDAVDLSTTVSEVMNRQFNYARISDDLERVEKKFNNEIHSIPLLDDSKRLSAIAFKRKKALRIGEVELNQASAAFIIAEIGINHNGDFNLAKNLIKLACDAGADCVKFQMRDMESLYENKGVAGDLKDDLGTQYTLDVLTEANLTNDEMYKLFDYCKQLDVLPLCTPFDLKSVNVLENYGIDFYKSASADLTNHQLMNSLSKTGKPLIVSTGMSETNEIIQTTQLLRNNGVAFALLHCNSTYPAPFKDVNLRYMSTLEDIGQCIVGYSGHERGFHIPLAAITLGAKIIEKHFTIDRNMKGNDHKVSLLPNEFSEMVRMIREVEESLGKDGGKREITQGERMNRENLAKSLVATTDIGIGEEIKNDMVTVKSPGKGIQPNKINELIGRRTKREISKGEFFYPEDLMDHIVTKRRYKFKRPFGLPVRFHDYQTLISKTNPDFIEFHLSYNDLDADWRNFFRKPLDIGLVVHSPDLFRGDHLLNLADEKKEARQRSIDELQRVIDLTHELSYFFKEAKPLIVASLGGFSREKPLSKDQILEKYSIIGESLNKLDTKNTEIIAQTLPPFPWYIGGQLFCNLFVDPEDTVDFCKHTGTRICLDLAHSKLAMNHRKRDFNHYLHLISPYVAHLHIVDAEGVDGEGYQIGDGDIDFESASKILSSNAPHAGFIPEIWQGHKNDGEGFWVALERLEGLF